MKESDCVMKADSNCTKAPKQNPLVSTDDVCDNNQLFVRYELNQNLTLNWDPIVPVFMQEVSNYSMVWDEEMDRVMYSFPPRDCLKDRALCKDWQIPQQFFCTEPIMAGVIMWLTVFILPTFILNLTIFLVVLRRSFVRTLLHFPPLLLQGIFGVFLFGPVNGIQGILRKEKVMVVSKMFTVINFGLCLLQQSVAIFILTKNFAWKNILADDNFLYSTSLTTEERSALHAIRTQLYLSLALLLINLLCTVVVLKRVKIKEQLDPNNLYSYDKKIHDEYCLTIRKATNPVLEPF